MQRLTDQRLAGLNLPLTSLRTEHDWGVGELPDLEALGPLCERAGLRLILLLPLLEPTLGQESPYSPLSAFALDPLLIRVEDVPEMAALGGRGALGAADRAAIAEARGSFPSRPERIRPVKARWLRRCWERFREAASPARRAAFDAFRVRERAWLEDYALFRALKARHPASWRDWPAPLRDFEAAAVAEARAALADEIEHRAWLQWVAAEQLRAAREALAARGIHLGGDEPFLTAEDSVDVWAHQRRYRFDATVGAPPDAFSDDGQDWGLPPYRWERIAAEDYRAFEDRGRRAAEHFDVVRVDHVVGLFRTYNRPRDPEEEAYFVPEEEEDQIAQGEAVLKAFARGGLSLLAEDLGVVPDFVRETMEALAIPGYRVIRWEVREGVVAPDTWPEHSVATTGTHDTESLAEWWDQNPEERPPFLELPAFARLDAHHTQGFTPEVREALLRTTFESPSNLAIVPLGDLFGLSERVNMPNTVGAHNWTWRLPWSLSTVEREAHLVATLERVGRLVRASGR